MAFARKLWQRPVVTRVAEVTVGTAITSGPVRAGRRSKWRGRGHSQDYGRPRQDFLLLFPNVVRCGCNLSRGHRAPAVLLILPLQTAGVVSGGGALL